VFLTGKLGGWTAPKDVIAFVAGRLSVSGGTNAVLEYIGPGARALSATGKATIANMGAEVGATTSVFPADASMSRYLEATGRGELVPLVERHRHLFEPDPAVEADPERFYDQVIRLDLSTLEPHVVGPHSPDRARPISQPVAEIADPASGSGVQDAIDVALIGSCTNSSYEDISRAADVARQAIARGLVAKTALLVTPGSERVRATLERDGLLAPLEAAGARVLASACGPCIGQWKREGASERSTIVTSFNRNFAGRNDGRATTMSFIASPEIVMALAFAGRLSFNPLVGELTAADGARFRLEPPAPAPDVPSSGFVQSAPSYDAPPAEGGSIAIALDPKSERLQELAPWPEWDGEDFVDLPVLIKARGKTTTDAISPAGPWLRFRGHLDRFSDNLLSGAADADTGEVGTTLNRFTGQRGPVASVARDYRARGLRWVIVADANYGEGSSREHAALSPRLLGGVAVVARSFARIHESNLKKQGLLALTFEDPADYDRIGGRDTVSLVGLSELAPGRKVLCRVTHPDGSSVDLRLVHSYSHSQIEWFRAGSALAARYRRWGGPDRGACGPSDFREDF
jgi:aconitate hydratase